MFENFLKIFSNFEQHGVENPLVETLRLYDILSNRAISHVDRTYKNKNCIDLNRLVSDRKHGVPTEYSIGKASFLGRLFECSSDALIPREETELLVKTSVNLIDSIWPNKKINIIDMGTGCGNIAVSIALHSTSVKVLASDLNDGHIKISKMNVDKFNLQEQISLFCGDLFAPLENKGYENSIEMIVCNPPYIPTGSINSKLGVEIKDNEPLTAFDGGAFGIDIYRRLINDSVKFLKKGGILIFEIGAGQEKLVTRLLNKNGNYCDIEYFNDGKDIRVIKSVLNQDTPDRLPTQ